MGWIILAVVVIGAALLWRAARKRSHGASIKNGPISRNESVNLANIQMQAQQHSQTDYNGGSFG